MSPDVAAAVLNQRRPTLHRLEQETGTGIVIKSDPAFGVDHVTQEFRDTRGRIIGVALPQPPQRRRMNRENLSRLTIRRLSDRDIEAPAPHATPPPPPPPPPEGRSSGRSVVSTVSAVMDIT